MAAGIGGFFPMINPEMGGGSPMRGGGMGLGADPSQLAMALLGAGSAMGQVAGPSPYKTGIGTALGAGAGGGMGGMMQAKAMQRDAQRDEWMDRILAQQAGAADHGARADRGEHPIRGRHRRGVRHDIGQRSLRRLRRIAPIGAQERSRDQLVPVLAVGHAAPSWGLRPQTPSPCGSLALARPVGLRSLRSLPPPPRRRGRRAGRCRGGGRRGAR